MGVTCLVFYQKSSKYKKEERKMRVWEKEAKEHVFQTLMPRASSSLSCEFSL